MFKLVRPLFFVALCLVSQSSFAILHLVLTQGVDTALPIAMVPFSEPTNAGVSGVIAADLQNSGRFKIVTQGDPTHQEHAANHIDLAYWQKQNANYLIVGNVTLVLNDEYRVEYSVVNLYRDDNSPQTIMNQQAPILLSETFTVKADRLRGLAHHISDTIYQKILGEPGIFSTKLAYVLLQRTDEGPRYQLMIADYDGYNPQPILVSQQPIMSPAWAPNGKKIAYVSFETGLARIYISDIATGKRQLITRFPGINGAPAFSPNGAQLAVVLSKGQNPNIYVVNLANGQLDAMTKDYAINTEPAWSSDGNSILFTSDRGGSPQVYQITLSDKKITRLTFSGNYNTNPSVSPDNKSVLLLHRGEDTANQFGIGLLDLSSGVIQVLASDNDQSPSMSPNGAMIIYATQNKAGQGELAMVSSDGRVRLKLPSAEGDVREPAWSPYLN